MFKRSRIQAIFITIAIGAVLAIAGLLLLHTRQPKTAPGALLISGSLEIPVTIADTDAAREQGLSGTAALPQNTGELFVFDQPGNYGFWMKDMNYGLDLVWIDSAMNIVGSTSNIAANTYPKIFYPPQDIQYVLEVNAGFSTAHNLGVGQHFTLQK